MSDNTLIMVFTRNPELGKVKTRLAKTVGNESALNIYKFLLEHTEKTIRKINVDKAVFYSEKIQDNDIWDSSVYQKYQQTGNDLGERMQNAFNMAFHNNYQKVIIIGSDLYELKPKHINKAINELDKDDVVIGPAKDGGYYLLGLKRQYPEIFKNKSWGISKVLQQTLYDLTQHSVFLLEELNDIDTFEDVKNSKILKAFI